jgi:transcription antitermination factor NusG
MINHGAIKLAAERKLVKDAGSFQEGEEVTINYGGRKGQKGTIKSFEPSGKFAIVSVGGTMVSLHLSDLIKA